MPAKATRLSFGEAIAKIGEKNLQVVVMDADLGKSTMTGEFQKKFVPCLSLVVLNLYVIFLYANKDSFLKMIDAISAL